MSVLRPPAAEDGDRAADGAKAAAGNARSFADSSGSGSGSGSSSSTASPPPPPTRLETSDAAALVFSLAAAALAARLSPLIALAVLAEGGFYLWQRYRYDRLKKEKKKKGKSFGLFFFLSLLRAEKARRERERALRRTKKTKKNLLTTSSRCVTARRRVNSPSLSSVALANVLFWSSLLIREGRKESEMNKGNRRQFTGDAAAPVAYTSSYPPSKNQKKKKLLQLPAHPRRARPRRRHRA